jgi:hypothetical protein
MIAPYWSLVVLLPMVALQCLAVVREAERYHRRRRARYRIEDDNVFYLNTQPPNT